MVGILLFVTVHLIEFVSVFICENSKMASQNKSFTNKNIKIANKISIF